MIKAVLFDFGGVIAEEGFREGLKAIAVANRLDPEWFFRLADDLIYEVGYVLGKVNEQDYWRALRERTGIKEDNSVLRNEVLKRFTLRQSVLEIADGIRAKGIRTAILSDQTNWLDELNEMAPFYQHFDLIYNSYKTGKGKRDSSVFLDVCRTLNVQPDEAVFVDDNLKNIDRARGAGLKTIHFRSIAELNLALKTLLKGL